MATSLYDFFPESDYVVHLVNSPTDIRYWLESKSAATWGQGKLGDLPYWKLAMFSPPHLGEKSHVFVATVEYVEYVQKEMEK